MFVGVFVELLEAVIETTVKELKVGLVKVVTEFVVDNCEVVDEPATQLFEHVGVPPPHTTLQPPQLLISLAVGMHW